MRKSRRRKRRMRMRRKNGEEEGTVPVALTGGLGQDF